MQTFRWNGVNRKNEHILEKLGSGNSPSAFEPFVVFHGECGFSHVFDNVRFSREIEPQKPFSDYLICILNR